MRGEPWPLLAVLIVLGIPAALLAPALFLFAYAMMGW